MTAPSCVSAIHIVSVQIFCMIDCHVLMYSPDLYFFLYFIIRLTLFTEFNRLILFKISRKKLEVENQMNYKLEQMEYI